MWVSSGPTTLSPTSHLWQRRHSVWAFSRKIFRPLSALPPRRETLHFARSSSAGNEESYLVTWAFSLLVPRLVAASRTSSWISPGSCLAINWSTKLSRRVSASGLLSCPSALTPACFSTTLPVLTISPMILTAAAGSTPTRAWRPAARILGSLSVSAARAALASCGSLSATSVLMASMRTVDPDWEFEASRARGSPVPGIESLATSLATISCTAGGEFLRRSGTAAVMAATAFSLVRVGMGLH